MYQCKNCGDRLIYHIQKKVLVCESCQSEFLINAYADESLTAAPSYEINAYICPQCAGEIVSADEQAVAYCPYCGSQVSLDKRVDQAKRPALIAPFSIGRTESRQKLLKMAEKKPFVPKELTEPEAMDRMIGIYMPYWLYDIHINGHMDGTSLHTYHKREGGKEYLITEYIRNEFDYKGVFSCYPKDGSIYFDDHISNKILPFRDQEEEAEELFHPAYLCGFYADMATVPEETYRNTVLNEVLQDYLGQEDLSALAFPSLKKKQEILQKDKAASKAEAKLGLFPVWFQTFRTENHVSYGVVNGKNGNLFMDLPVDMKSFLLSTLFLMIPLFFLFYLSLPPFDIKELNIIAGFIAILGMFLGMHIQKKKADRKETLLTLEDDWKKGMSLRQRSKLLWRIRNAALFLLFLIVARFYGVFPGLAIAVLVYALFGFPRRMNAAVFVSFLAALIVGFVSYLDPADDIYYYGALFLSGLALVVSLLFIAYIQKSLCERKLPYFDRKELDGHE